MPRALIVDDQPRVGRALALLLEIHDIDAIIVDSPDRALAALGAERFDVVLQDMNFSPGATDGREGEELLRRIRSRAPDVPVLLLTAWGSLDSAVRAMRDGAADYVEKPWDDDRLVQRVRELLAAPPDSAPGSGPGGRDLTVPWDADADLRGMVVRSPATVEVVRLALRAAPSEVSVLITGENGTGKEKLAEVVQANSRRREKPFVRVDVGAFPESLLEAELFGAEPGAYTGARERRIGVFEAADGGTILLDEIGNLDAAGQSKLLRVLESGEFQRLGSPRLVRADVRVLAATNADLRAAVDRGDFREDLFFRLAVLELRLPPLRQRVEEIDELAEGFLRRSGADARMRFSSAAEAALRAHHWPGNVRELRNVVQRAAVVAEGAEIGVADLGLTPAGSLPTEGAGSSSNDAASRHEKAAVEAALVAAGGVVARAADTLGISRQALYRKMDRLGIVLERRVRR